MEFDSSVYVRAYCRWSGMDGRLEPVSLADGGGVGLFCRDEGVMEVLSGVGGRLSYGLISEGELSEGDRVVLRSMVSDCYGRLLGKASRGCMLLQPSLVRYRLVGGSGESLYESAVSVAGDYDWWGLNGRIVSKVRRDRDGGLRAEHVRLRGRGWSVWLDLPNFVDGGV